MNFYSTLSLLFLSSLFISISANLNSNSNSLHNKILKVKRSNSTNKQLVAQVADTLPSSSSSSSDNGLGGFGGGFFSGIASIQSSIASDFGFTSSSAIPTDSLTTSLPGIQTPTATKTSIKTANSIDPSTSTSITIVSPSVVVVNITSTLSTSSTSSSSTSRSTLASSSSSITTTSASPVTVLSTAQALTSTSLLTPVPTATSNSTSSSNNLSSNNSHMSTPAKVTVVTLIIIGSSIAVLLIAFTVFRKFGFGRKSGKWASRTRAPSTFWEPHPENRDMTEVVLNEGRGNMSGRNSQGEWIGFDEDARSIRSGRSGQGMAGVGASRNNDYGYNNSEFSRTSSFEDNRAQTGFTTVERYGSSGGRSYKGAAYP